MTYYRILEVKHHAPWDGCMWEYNYFLLDLKPGQGGVGHVVGLQAIFSQTSQERGYHILSLLEADRLYHNAIKGIEVKHDFPYDEPVVYKLDDKLHDDLPTNLIPIFCRFFNGGIDSGPIRDLGKPFVWRCDYGHELTSERPSQATGYIGNRGIGVTFDGWVCEEHDWEYNHEKSIEWTDEVLSMHFDQCFLDGKSPPKLTSQVVSWMDENENYYDSNEEGGGYPDESQVRRALEALGYRDLEQETE